MHTLTIFWLPIVLSAAAVWVASAIAWMLLPHHKGDKRKLPDEAGFSAMLRSAAIPPGTYGFPDCEGHAKMNDPEFQKRWKEGPNGFLTICGDMSMGKNMVLTFLVYLAISYCIAYLAGVSGYAHGAAFMDVFKFIGTAGILAYSFSFIPNMIWFCAYPRAIAMCVLDGIVYGLITGAIFAACWPKV